MSVFATNARRSLATTGLVVICAAFIGSIAWSQDGGGAKRPPGSSGAAPGSTALDGGVADSGARSTVSTTTARDGGTPTVVKTTVSGDAGTTVRAVAGDAGATMARSALGDAGVARATMGDGGASAMNTGDGGAPWTGVAATKESSIPSFLDTTDRRIQETRKPPTAAQVAALEEMRAELDRFAKSGTSYKDTVAAIVRREYLRRRRSRDDGFSRQIRLEEKQQNAARGNAIRMFEQFVEAYPNEPNYTPDAMFRLGELYYERSAIQFQDAFAERENSQDADGGPAVARRDTPDFSPTVELYQRIVKEFPNYRNIGGVYYLIGYCLNEMGRQDEARVAWLNLVCANHFVYKPEAAPLPPTAAGSVDEAAEEEAKKHPALGLDAKKPDSGPFVDPYEGCKPVQPDAQFIAETWLRIGEYHFDLDYDKYGLDRAISAYKKLLAMPSDRNYNLALYKLAWAYYRASRYPDAIKHFGLLVQWSDDERKRTGKAGSELRAEAIQYLGIAFAYDDWNENQVPDVQEGQPPGIDRVQNPQLLPQDRPWTAEVYFQLGTVYFDEAKYPEAIRVWQLALNRWPNHEHAPEIQNMIARAHVRNNEMDAAIAARSQLSKYGEGTDWWNANVDHPAAQRKAEELAENALIGTAVHHHERAQQLRRQGVENQDIALIKQAQEQYQLAAKAYRGYLQRYPNSPQAYELRYNLADALFWAENYEESAAEYAAVRDSNLDDTHLSESARRVVESLRRLVEQAQAQKQLAIREKPPEPQGTPPQVMPIAMPQLLQRLAQAREMYLARVDRIQDTEHVRDSYEYNNALLLYMYGYWPQAKDRFTRIFANRCSGATADDTGRVAWLNLRNMAVAMGDTAEVERLGKQLQTQKCTFKTGAGAVAAVNCALPENKEEPQCLAGQDLTNIKYARAVEVFAEAEKATGDTQRKKYEEAASMLVKAVNEEPRHPQAPLALEKAAIALERTNRFDSAGRLYQRIIDEVGPRKAANADDQKQLDAILSNAYFRLAFNANRFFDYDRAVENYKTLADSPRFAKSTDPGMRERREGALINAATILEYQQQYSRAADYYRRAADVLQVADEQRAARYRVAEMAFKQKAYGQTIKEMKAFVDRYRSDPKAGELVVQAQWRIAQSQKELNKQKDYRKSLDDVVAVYARSGQQPGSVAAEYAAQARFQIVDEGSQEFESFAIKPGKPKTLQAYVSTVTEQIESGSKEAKRRAESYNTVPEYRRPKWTIGAFVRQGRIYEVLAKAVLNTPFAMPKDLEDKIRRAPPEAKEEVRIQVEDSIRQVLDQRVRPIECLAVARYALAARAARAGSLDNEYTRQAVDRLQAYGDERIAECVAQAAAQDASFAAYQPGEFTRAPRGQTLGVEGGMSSPPLAPERP